LTELVTSLQSNRKGKPISNFFKSFLRTLWRGLRTVLKGENIRFVSSKIHFLQIKLSSFLKRRFIGKQLLSLFRNHSATIVVAACVLLVALINLSSAKGARGFIFGSLALGPQNPPNSLKSKLSIQNEKKNNLAIAPLSGPGYLADVAVLSSEEQNTNNEYEVTAMAMPTVQSQVLLATYTPQVSSAGRQEAKNYQVKDGDTIGLIAAKNGVSANTILWANNLTEVSVIKPGDKLTILPVTGIKYKIQKGDSLEAIANKYNADKEKVLAYNDLPADEKLREGQELILPDGYVSSPTAPASALGTTRLAIAGQAPTTSSSYSSTSAYSPIKMSGGGAGHRFPYGYCTWYVAQRRYVPWGGNAISWLSNARSSGKATGSTPRPGAIMVSGESRWGHVAIVESVSGSSFTISEMNYAGFGKKDTRTLSTGSGFVKGFIY
jgi:surface antigen